MEGASLPARTEQFRPALDRGSFVVERGLAISRIVSESSSDVSKGSPDDYDQARPRRVSLGSRANAE